MANTDNLEQWMTDIGAAIRDVENSVYIIDPFIYEGRAVFSLTQKPLCQSNIIVTVNENQITNYAYDDYTNEIVIYDDLTINDEISVSYYYVKTKEIKIYERFIYFSEIDRFGLEGTIWGNGDYYYGILNYSGIFKLNYLVSDLDSLIVLDGHNVPYDYDYDKINNTIKLKNYKLRDDDIVIVKYSTNYVDGLLAPPIGYDIDDDFDNMPNRIRCLYNWDGVVAYLSGYLDTIPEGVTELGYSAFRNYPIASSPSKVASITIPSSVEKIEKYAFMTDTIWGSGFELVNFEEGSRLRTIGERAFSSGTLKGKLELPDSLYEIEPIKNTMQTADGGAFRSALIEELVFPGNLNQATKDSFGHTIEPMGYETFYNCYKLKKITMKDGTIRVPNRYFYFCSSLIDLKLSNIVETIGEEAFYNNRLTCVKLPSTVKTLGNKAFYHRVSSSTPPNDSVIWLYDSINLESISKSCFSYTAAKSIICSDSIRTIGQDAFYWNRGIYESSLGAVYLGRDIQEVAERAFEAPSTSYGRRVKVYYYGTETDATRITIGNNNKVLTNATWVYNQRFGSEDLIFNSVGVDLSTIVVTINDVALVLNEDYIISSENYHTFKIVFSQTYSETVRVSCRYKTICTMNDTAHLSNEKTYSLSYYQGVDIEIPYTYHFNFSRDDIIGFLACVQNQRIVLPRIFRDCEGMSYWEVDSPEIDDSEVQSGDIFTIGYCYTNVD